MITTIELSDDAFRQAKVLAASRGKTLKRFFINALAGKTPGMPTSTRLTRKETP